MEKVEPYKEYKGNAEQTKLLTKCLYLIEYLVEKRVEDLYDAFDERADLFEEIRKEFISNRKINEITAHILKMYNIEATTEGYSQMKNEAENKQQQQPSQVSQNVNLLDIDEGNNNNPDLLLQSEGEQNKTGIDLLSDIFGGTSNPSTTMNQQVNLLDDNTNMVKQEEKKGFGFIKPKPQAQMISQPQQEVAPKKKGFSFIKNKDTNTNINVNVNINIPNQQSNDLNSIFNPPTAPQNNIINLVENSNPMENIFTNQQTQQFPTIDLTKIQNAYKDTYKAPEQKPISTPQPNFNYNLVYQNTNALKDKKANDPFGFVDDILKSKK